MRDLSLHAAVLLVVGSLLVTHGARAGEPPEPMSIHEAELRAHTGEIPPARVLPDELPTPRERVGAAGVVYGYYPFWVADLTTIRWEALTHLAWFSVDLDENGNVVATNGWPDDAVVDTAHAAGVRVDLTFTLFGGQDIESLCTSPAKRASTIDTMVTMMENGGADGISVDFEFVNGDTREAFVTFISELRAELDARGHSDAEISIAGPTIDWSDGIDLPALLDVADWYFVMGYGYFWSGSGHAGPTGLLRVTPEWAPYQSHSMIRTIATYSAQIDAEQRQQIIWGVPYYGRRWTTAAKEKGAETLESLGAVTYSAAKKDVSSGAFETLWDEGVANPWYRKPSGGDWQQVYYDDADSLAAKYAVAIDQDLGGVGMWALNYDKPHSELWDLLEETFATPPEISAGHRLDPLPIESFPFHDERDTTVGPSHYFNHYGCAPEVPEWGREWVYEVDVCQPGRLEAEVPSYDDRDPDLHLLSSADQDACLARADTLLETTVEPGRHLLVVDTYVDVPVELEGPYALDVDFIPEPGTAGCADHLVCDDGSCVCPNGTTGCGDACVDTSSDPDHCGGCGQSCATGASCVDGACQPADDPPPASPPSPPEGGCTCRTSPRGPAGRGGLAALALLAAAWLRRRFAYDRMISYGNRATRWARRT